MFLRLADELPKRQVAPTRRRRMVNSSLRLSILGGIEAHDFRLNNAWVEGSEGDGVGEFLEYTIDTESSSLRVTGLTIFNSLLK